MSEELTGDTVIDSTHPLDPRHTALLAMDIQPAILDLLGDGAEQVLTRLTTAIDVARSRDMLIVHVWAGFAEEDYALVPAHNKVFAPAAAARAFHHEAPEVAIHSAVLPRETEIIVRKSRVSAFAGTDLDRLLHERNITTLILAGITTSGVILSTVRQGADHDYRLLVLSDAVSDPDPELHRILIEKVLPWQAQLVTTDELGRYVSDGV